MSMRFYPISVDAAFYVTRDVIISLYVHDDIKRGIASEEIRELVDTGQLASEIEQVLNNPCGHKDSPIVSEGYIDAVPYELPDEYSFCYASEFEGSVTTLFPDRAKKIIDEEYGGDVYISYIPTQKGASLFKAAYSSPEEMLEEFKQRLQDLLPADFDWWSHIVTISGTTFC